MSLWSWFKPKETYQAYCGHEAIYCARVLQDNGFEVRIRVGERNGVAHAQAQRKKNNKWEWLKRRGSEVVVTSADVHFTDTTSYPLENFWLQWKITL